MGVFNCLITLIFGAVCAWFSISGLCLSYLTWDMGLHCFFLIQLSPPVLCFLRVLSVSMFPQCFHEDVASFCAGLSNTFLCPTQRWLICSFLKEKMLYHQVVPVIRKFSYLLPITSSPKRHTSFPLSASLIRRDLI